MESVKIEGIEYQVEKQEDKYLLHGPRGARYFTMRNVNRPNHMFLINDRGFTKKAPGVWLSDADGSLRVIR